MITPRLFVLAALPLAFLLNAQADTVDNSPVLGKWTVKLEFQGQSREIVYEFTQAEDGSLSGTATSPRGSGELADVAWDGETLTFARNLERQGQQFSINYSATVDGDTMDGTMTTPRGERPFKGERKR